MSKTAKTIHTCTACGSEFSKWAGQCADCGAWNTLVESVKAPVLKGPRAGGYAGQAGEVTVLDQVRTQDAPRVATGLSELDRVLGGGLVAGSVVLILLWVYYSSLILLFGAAFTKTHLLARGRSVVPRNSAPLPSRPS